MFFFIFFNFHLFILPTNHILYIINMHEKFMNFIVVFQIRQSLAAKQAGAVMAEKVSQLRKLKKLGKQIQVCFVI